MLSADTDFYPGDPFPQGATWDGNGVNFAFFSESSTAVELCLFDRPDATSEARRIRLRERTNGVWHIYLPGLAPGQLYGFRCYGPYDPEQGLRFNPRKLLLDPYAKAIGRGLTWDDSLFGYTIGHSARDLSFDERDSAAFAPLAEVVDARFDWRGDESPRHPWHETVIYEAHVKGQTKLLETLPPELRGTYAGLGSPEAISHFVRLGVTAVELMPIHYFLHDRHLLDAGRCNYWGYNTLGFFAPHPDYAFARKPAETLAEFKAMVRSLHAAGLEVLLDVVYNHTAEGSELGPTLSLRGIDNRAYYRTVPGQDRYYLDYTGCGNTLNTRHPHTLQLIMDSLRYWVTECHIDGFRFDLAAALARELRDVNQLSAFFNTIYQDPVLATIKLIAEPWDLGEGGYQVGKFPLGWTEWNGKFRDSMRQLWRGDLVEFGEVARRLSGSPDLYEHTGKLPTASINFVAAHDCFTLHDLVSYEERHNEANGENNNDGDQRNHSTNHGVEGLTDDPEILARRGQHLRNLLATLFLAQGVPMLCAGDEFGQTQQGNNNGYCQDNELTWLDWKLDPSREELLEYAARLIQLRRQHPNFRRRSFRETDPTVAPERRHVHWSRADGTVIDPFADDPEPCETLLMMLPGDAREIRDARGLPMHDDDFILALNVTDEEAKVELPAAWNDRAWRCLLDTAAIAEGDVFPASGGKLAPESLIVLTRPCAVDEAADGQLEEESP